MQGEIYLDVVFVTNLLMDYLLLHLLGKLFSIRSRPAGKVLGAAFGAAGSCLLLYLSVEPFFPAGFFFHLFFGAVMICLAYKISSAGLLMKTLTALYLAAFLCGGFWDVLSSRREIDLKTFLFFSVCTYGVLNLAAWGKERVRRRARIYPVTLRYEGRECTVTGLYDTGNLLRDTLFHSPVSIISSDTVQELFSEEICQCLKNITEEPGELENTVLESLKPHFLRCRTVAGEQLLLALTIEKMSIQSPGEELQIPHPVLAMTLEPSTLGKEYQILLNSEFMQ